MFLQYLWGIETPPANRQPSLQEHRFYSTYEELKQAFEQSFIK